jgi:hypothetical protein
MPTYEDFRLKYDEVQELKRVAEGLNSEDAWCTWLSNLNELGEMFTPSELRNAKLDYLLSTSADKEKDN